jgi:hypothetical protein
VAGGYEPGDPALVRSQTPSALGSLLAPETGEVYIVLLTIQPGGGGSPFHFSSDSVDTLSNGTTYAAFPFDITLPKNVDNQISTAQLSVTNVDRRLIEAIRGQTEAMTVDIEVVLSSETTTTMVKYVDFTWRNLAYDAMTVSGTLTLEDFLNEQVGHIMTAANYKSIFYA